MSFSLVINHTPWNEQRVDALCGMRLALFAGTSKRDTTAIPFGLNAADYRGTDWQISKVKWALEQWRWADTKPTTHHVFMTDDLHVAPHFWDILTAMVDARPNTPIGLLSNHPLAVQTFAQGHHGYRTNSWLVGPAYVVPHAMLVSFLAWFEALPDGNAPGCKGHANDDSSWNEWITKHGPGECWHPLPTIIEHRADIGSTVGHGDRFSRERLSWRESRQVTPSGQWLTLSGPGVSVDQLCDVEFWKGEAPMLKVGE